MSIETNRKANNVAGVSQLDTFSKFKGHETNVKALIFPKHLILNILVH